jgi:hypothetical protein
MLLVTCLLAIMDCSLIKQIDINSKSINDEYNRKHFFAKIFVRIRVCLVRKWLYSFNDEGENECIFIL